MSKLLLIGDVHSKVEDLEDCRRLRLRIVDVTKRERPDNIVFLGDQYDAHAIVHVEVQRFWLETFEELRAIANVIALVGNHDRPGNAASIAHSMQVHRAPRLQVVDQPYRVGPLLFLPYYHDQKDLVVAGQQHADAKVVFCHATFDGAKYDNGFYAKEAVSPDLLPGVIVSGHIHTPGTFGKVWYPGSPRWQTISDANISRAINVIDVDENGWFHDPTPFSTDDCCRRIWQLLYTPEDRCEKEFAVAKPGDLVVVNVQGPRSFCEESKRKLQAPGLRIRTFPTDRAAAKLSEAQGVPAAFMKHFKSYQPRFGTSKDVLRAMFRERLSVAALALKPLDAAEA